MSGSYYVWNFFHCIFKLVLLIYSKPIIVFINLDFAFSQLATLFPLNAF